MTSTQSINIQFDSDGTVELAGNAEALHGLATLIRSVAPTSITLGKRTSHSEPQAISVAVEPGDDKMRILRRADELVITGRLDAREVFASNIDAFADRPEEFGGHIHIEFFPDHFYLAQGSAPVIVSTELR